MLKKSFVALFVCALTLLYGCGAEPEKTVLEPPSGTASEQSAAETEPSSVPEQAPEIKLYLNGNRMELVTAPVMEGELVMVPIAEICEAFSRPITAQQEDSVLTLEDTEKSSTIVVTAGESKAVLNGSAVEMKASATLAQDGVLLVELSSFRSLLDADNKYQPDITAAYITESGLC